MKECLTSLDIAHVGSPLSSCVLTLDLWTSLVLNSCWSTTSVCETTRSAWTSVEHRRFTEILVLNKVHLASIVGILTIHCPSCCGAKNSAERKSSKLYRRKWTSNFSPLRIIKIIISFQIINFPCLSYHKFSPNQSTLLLFNNSLLVA